MGKDVQLWETRKVPGLLAMSLPPTWGDVVPNKRAPRPHLLQGCADGREDGWPRAEHQNRGHRTCSCCSRLAFPKPCLTPTQAQMEVKEHLRKSAFHNSRNPIPSRLCRDLGRPRESNTPHWQDRPFTQDARGRLPSSV